LVKISSPNDLIPTHRFLIIIFKSRNIHFEADERSKTNPGHGYPERDEKIETYEFYACVNDESLKLDLEKLFEENKNRKDILVIKIGQIVPVAVSLKIDLNQTK
jgi:hypothetical protein